MDTATPPFLSPSCFGNIPLRNMQHEVCLILTPLGVLRYSTVRLKDASQHCSYRTSRCVFKILLYFRLPLLLRALPHFKSVSISMFSGIISFSNRLWCALSFAGGVQSTGLEYLPGGVASGFNKMEKDVFRNRLLHVKGKRVVRVSEVRFSGETYVPCTCFT